MFKKTSLCFLLASVLIYPAYAGNSDKVLLPLSEWNIERALPSKDNTGRNCLLRANFENDTSLFIAARNGFVTEIGLQDPLANFVTATEPADVFFIPNKSIRVKAQSQDNKTIIFDTKNVNDVSKFLKSALLLEFKFAENSYRFSTGKIANYIEALQTCRLEKPSAEMEMINFDDKKNIISNNHASAPPKNISAFPFDKDAKNVRETSKNREDMVSEIQKLDVASKDSDKTVFEEIAFESQEALTQPPEFNQPLASINNNHSSTYEADTIPRRLARINAETNKIEWQDTEIIGSSAPMLSQSKDQAKSEPIIVRKIDTRIGEKRFDITNREITDVQREMSNQEFEQKLKQVSNLNSSEISSQSVEETDTEASINTMKQNSEKHSIQWNAQAGDNLRDIIASWSVAEDVQLVWDTSEQFKVLKNVSFEEGYEKALTEVLSQFIKGGDEKRPVGQLFIDPSTGQKMLVVTSN